jgi:hypothetical protein
MWYYDTNKAAAIIAIIMGRIDMMERQMKEWEDVWLAPC